MSLWLTRCLSFHPIIAAVVHILCVKPALVPYDCNPGWALPVHAVQQLRWQKQLTGHRVATCTASGLSRTMQCWLLLRRHTPSSVIRVYMAAYPWTAMDITTLEEDFLGQLLGYSGMCGSMRRLQWPIEMLIYGTAACRIPLPWLGQS